ncbi:spore coat protein GerQ [Paenibacillus abyssi]
MYSPYNYRNVQGSYNAPYTAYAQGNANLPSAPPAAQPVPTPYMAQGKMMQQAQMIPPPVPSGATVTPSGTTIVTAPAVEESYVENILRLNRGKMATVYMTYENNREWNAKIFKGVIEAAGRDHLILSDPVTGMRYLLLTLNLDYITFDEPIKYEYPFHGGIVTDTSPIGTTSARSLKPSR